MAASIVVDIKAQITGYQEQIAKIQQALSKVKLDSDIGKELTKELENVQKLLNNLGKNTNVRLGSERGIDQLTDKLTNVGEKILNITNLANNITFDDIDTSKLGTDFDELLKKIQDLKNSMEQDMNSGIQQAINNSSELKKVFEEAGQDINSITKDQALELLENALKNATERATEAKEKIAELNQTITDQKNVLENLDKSPFLSGDFNLNKTIGEFNKLKNVKTEKVFDKNSFEDVRTEWIGGLAELAKGTDEQKEKIATLIANMVEPKSIEQARQQFTTLSIQIKNILGDVSDSIIKNGIFGGDTATSFGQKLFHIDESAIENAKSVIKEAVNKFKEAFSEADLNSITTKLNNNQIKEAFNLISARISEGYDDATQKVQEGKAKLQAAQNELVNAEQIKNIAETDVSKLTAQIDDLKDTIKQLNNKLAAQQKELERLKKSVDQKVQQAVENAKKTTLGVGSNVKQELNDAAQAAGLYKTKLEQVQAREQLIGKIEGVVQRWFSIYAAVRMVSQAIHSVISTVKELDKTITEIAIVTNMTQDQLWSQMQSYTDMARQYAASISGVYEVSQLYYQQGLQTADVMALTEETLKMARISGLDYTTATDYMTNAVRSFKMEMQDAQKVVDVYSEVAASSATSTSELATAMSKTASSAEAVGSSFENTTAMMAVMIEATRESPENIGSAMKSIISRYGELKTDPGKLVDSEGEALSLNKVDTALQSVGITIHDTAGQFRDFDEVIMELAGKWDTIDKNTQRYIATVMAGNRQQSRFLALVSNGERLTELSEKAANSQDTATLQVLKTMDSIEAKTQQLKTTLQSLYVDSGIENMYKGILDFGNSILSTFAQMNRWAGLPIPAIIHLGTTFASLANVVTTVFGLIKSKTQAQISALNIKERAAMQERVSIAEQELAAKDVIFLQEEIAREKATQHENQDERNKSQQRIRIWEEELARKQGIANTPIGAPGTLTGITKTNAMTSVGLNLAGVVLSGIAGGISNDNRIAKGVTGIMASTASMAGLGTMIAPGIGTGIGVLAGVIMGFIENLNILRSTAEDDAKRLKEAAEEANNTYLQRKAEYTDLQEQIDKLKELEKARNDNKEANEAYLEASNALANSYPELISYIGEEGNAIVDLSRTYDVLADARLKAQNAAIDAAEANAKEAETNAQNAENNRGKERQLTINDFLDQKVIEGSNKENKWKSATNREYLSVMALNPTNKDLLSLAASDFRDKAEAVEGEISDQYDLLATVYNTITTENADIAENFLNNNKEALQNIRSENKDDELIQAYFSLLDELTGDLLKIDADIKGKNAIADAANRSALQQLNYWQGQGKLENKETKNSAKFLTEFDGVSEVIDNYVFDQFKIFKDKFTGILGENDTYLSKFEESKDYQEAYETIYNQLKDFYNSLKTEAQKQNFNDLLASRGQYSPDQFKEILTTRYTNIGQELFNSLMSYYDDLFDYSNFVKEIHTRQIDNNTKLSFGDKLDELETLSSTELQSLLAVYDNILEQIKNNLISPNKGQEILNAYTDIWTATNELDPKLREVGQSILTEFDDFSLSGLDELHSKLEAAGIDPEVLEKVDALKNIVPINLNTEIQSLISKTTTGLEDYEKALSSATKGTNFKSAAEIAAKLGKSVQEVFDLRDGKLFIKNVEDIQKAYLGDNSEIIEKIQIETKRVQNQYLDRLDKNRRQITFSKGNEVFKWSQLNGGAKNSESLSVDAFTDLVSRHTQGFASLGFSPNDLINYYTEFYDTAEDASSDFLTWVSDKLGTQMEDVTKQLNAYITSLTANAALQAGDYQSFVNTVLADVEGEGSLQAERDAAIKLFENGDLKSLYDTFPAFAQAISETYSGISEGIYNKLLSESLADKYVADNGLNTSFLNSLGDDLVEITTDEQGNVIYKLKEITEKNIDDYFSAIDKDQNLTDSQKAAEKAKGTNKLWNESVNKLLQDVYKNVDSVSQETYEKLISKFGSDAIEAISKDNGNNTYTIDASGLQQLAQESGEDISEATLNMGEEAIEETVDDILKQISTAASLVTKGSFSPKEMQEFVTEYEKITGEKNVRTQNIFNYDQFSNQFKLSSAAYNNYIEAERKRLMELWNDEEAVTAYIDKLASDISYDSDTSNSQLQRNAISAAKDIIAKRTELTEEEIKKFADSLGLTYEQIKDAFTYQGNGYYTADIKKITNKLAEAGVIINDFILEEVNTALAAIQDNSNIMESGFSDIGAVMADFNNLKALTGEDLKFNEIYTIDPILHKYVYTANGLIIANNTQISSINSTLEESNTKLTEELELLNNVNTVTNTSGDWFLDLDANSTEIIDAYTEWASQEENVGKGWGEYYKQRKQQLEQQIADNKVLESTLPDLKEANKQIQFGKIDFKGIASGTVKFATAYNQFYNYLVAKYNAEGVNRTAEELEKEAEDLAKEYGEGGKTAAKKYKKYAGENFNIDIYNDILNQPASAAQSLFNKLKDYSGNVSIQLTESEAKFLKDADLIKEGDTSISPDELNNSYDTLMATIQKGLEKGSVSLQTANQIIADHQKTEEEKNNEYADAIVSTLTSGKITTDSLNQLASSLKVSLKEDFDINKISGISTNENGVQYVEDVDAFIDSFADQVKDGIINKEKIKEAFDLADKSKLKDSVVSANNSIIETLANNINSLKSLEIGKQINLTYLEQALGEKKLQEIFGEEAYSSGILTVNETIKNNLFDNFKAISTGLKEAGKDTTLVDSIISEYINSAKNEISSASVNSIISAETASVLVSYNQAWKNKVNADGKIILKTAQDYIDAVSDIYIAVKKSFEQGTSSLQDLNNSYTNIIKANNIKKSVGNDILKSATSLSTDSLNNFMTSMGYKLDQMLNESGDLINGWTDKIERTGIDSYRIKNWDKFITYLGKKIDTTSEEYIDAYIAWLDSEANVAPNAKEALMTSLVPNLERLSYAQIGQIAKTFKKTVEDVLVLVENNGDNTFNGAALLNSLEFDKSNKDFANALINQKQTVASNLINSMTDYINASADGHLTSYDEKRLKKGVDDYIKGMRALGLSIEIDTEKMYEILLNGGEDAVRLAQRIAAQSGQELSNEDIETLYRSSISSFVDAIDTVVAQPGEIVNEVTATLIRDNDGAVNRLGSTGQFVVESAANLYKVYNNLLEKMEKTGESTLADLNKVQALALENRLNSKGTNEQQVIDALGDAAGMTFTRFGEILTEGGIRLTEQMINDLEKAGIIDLMGGNKMRITDFTRFAELMNWEANSEEYVSAFKTYNDSLVQMNRQVEKNITEEIKAISDSKPGDIINLTQLTSELDKGVQEQLAEKLRSYGAILKDGLLALDSNANIPAIIKTITEEAAENGLILQDSMAELADALNQVLDNYSNLITNAIEGTLSNAEAQQLSVQARNFGFKGELDFKATAEGLKISDQAAASLYNHLKSVDIIRARLVFNKLYESITTSNEKLKTISGTTVEINNLQKKIIANEKRIAELRAKGNKSRASQIQKENDKLKDQLKLYKEIRLEQMGDPDSYAFMDKDLPDIFKGPQNYWNSVGKAFTAINEAGESGYMEIEDFYNFINEASNLVSMSGKSINLWGMQIDGSAENCASLIQKGFSALSNIDGEGVKVDLKRLGVNFKGGANGMADDFTAGVKSFAKSQIALIDATIAMLETFVAMQALGEIDVNKNGIFDFTAQELGTLDKEGEYIEKFGSGYIRAIQKIKQYFESNKNNKDLQNAYNNFKINGHSIKALLNASEDQLKQWGIKGKTLQKLLQKFYELSQSDEFATNPSEIWKQLAEELSDEELSELHFTFYSPGIGEMTIENGSKFGVDFKKAAEASAKEFLEAHGANSETLDESLKKAFEKYESGAGSLIDLTAVFIAQGKITVKDDGYYINGQGPFTGDETEFVQEVAKIALGDINAEGVYQLDERTFEGHIKYGNKEIRVTSDGGSPKYYSDAPGASSEGYDSLEELFKAEYALAGGKDKTGLEFEDWIAINYETHIDIKTNIISNLHDSEIRAKAKEVADMPLETIQKIIDDQKDPKIDSNGNIMVDVNGIQVAIENKGSLEQKANAVKNEITNSLDPDGWITKISTSITDAFRNLNIAQLFIDGFKTSLDVNVSGGTISFKSDPTIIALGANLGQGIAAGIASASSAGITRFFNSDTNKTTITTPIITGLKNTANDSEITDRDYEISKATASLKKMEINNVEEAGFSSSILSNILKAAQRLTGGSGSDLTLESATAAINKLSIVSVGSTDLQTQIQAQINAKVGTIDVSSITTAKQEIIDTISAVARNLTVLKNKIGDLDTNSINAKDNVDKLKTTLSYLAISQGPVKAEEFKKALNSINTNGPERTDAFKKSINGISDYGAQRTNKFKTALNEISSHGPKRAADFKTALNGIANYGPQRTTNFKNALNGIDNYAAGYASSFVKAVNSLKDKSGIAWNFVYAMNNMQHGGFTVDVYINDWRTYWNTRSWAKGNVALSKGMPTAQQNNPALAAGNKKTLVGELGPELVVSNGKYYVVGQNGAEMIDLPKDAIVFNHLQTKKLLGQGKGGRGTPVTNEKNAVSYATGNISGPALVNATQAIATLKQLRAMWEALLNSSAKQLGSQAGKNANKDKKTNTGSTGGSGGSSPTSTKPEETTAEDGTKIKTTTDEIQRWYNLLRQIDKTEKDITYEEKLQTQYQSLRIADGNALYKSYKNELNMLDAQIDRSQKLAKIQKDWYDEKRAELAASAYGKIFRYTEDGLQQYVSGKNKGLDILEKLTEEDIWGNPTGHARTAATQLSYIQSLGFDLSDLLSNSDGTKAAGSISSVNVIYDENGKRLEGQDLIDAQVAIMENFWDNIDGWRDELDGLYDSYREQVNKVIENQNQMNEIMQKIVDNQIEVENKVYDALIDAKQTMIDNAKKEMDAYKENSDDMINSLNDVLNKERALYNNQKNNDELLKLQRQLAILQRSGGSTSQILNLQQQIATKQQDMYFDEKQDQIKALQDASKLQIEKMEEQIELMSETLEYQKNNGLLWNEVISIMKEDQQSILEFITSNTSDWASKSALQTSQSIAELQTKIQLYTNSRDDEFIKYYDNISSNVEDIAQTMNIRNSSNSMPKYKKGGLIDFTGPAWVDGTSSRPEAILNANETKFVQNKLPDILNNVGTLQERQIDLQDIRTDWLSSISYVIDTNNSQNNSVNIEHVELNMQVKQLSNSSDAKKLGQEAFDELLNIARKAGKNSVSRR